MTGIGGQGVQLIARTLALAAMSEGHEVMVFGSYGGMMRGGNTDATVVLSQGRVLAPPTVSRYWAALAMHPAYWPQLRDRLDPAGFALVDASVFREPVDIPGGRVLEIEATRLATDLGTSRAAGMLALGAFVAATGIVSVDAARRAAHDVLPAYRQEHAAANARALQAGFELVEAPMVEAWPVAASVR